MAHARPFSTSTFQDLSNDIKNTSGQGVLTLAIELRVFGSPGGLQVPTFWECESHPHTCLEVGLRQTWCEVFVHLYIFLGGLSRVLDIKYYE
jgi:hypothetical protein